MRRVLGWLGPLMAMATAAAVAGETSTSLDTLRAVGREGAGNVAAQQAWQTVAAAPIDELANILAALDTADPLAANWIRAAVDSIAERELAADRPLPVDMLERFALETAHAPRARRLAFEWLTQVDATSPDRLIPQFIDDPSVELRRDAVTRLIAEGERQLDSADAQPPADQPGVATLQRAFAASRDIDQIDQLAERLKALGHSVDLPRHLGFVTSWNVVGPFDNTDEKAFDIAYPPEESIDLSAEYTGKDHAPVRWHAYSSDDEHGRIDLNTAVVNAKSVTGYALCEFFITEPREIEVRVASSNAHKVWINEARVMANHVYHSGTRHDQYVSRGRLQSGRNTILVKLLQDDSTQPWAGDWDFKLRVCDSVGTAVLSDPAGVKAP